MTNHSLTDFQHNPKYFVQQIKETQKTIVLTVNGKVELVIQDAVVYQKLLERLDYAESVAATREGITEFEQDYAKPARLALAELRKKHGI
ncbi:type II toxin-antitoxin system Phd/YefM family antitoxin [Okeania sp.]|uniref:type II toxin-antitoxin system Phd/YefM family antitoxin n=1 Tax=Okeania sp. TaxID=3100323 RepID=UPI002B4AE60A|nr:type II toxin-antitoxin system Phd/YefM family antitoxin [Okeania sp.]MEB3340693.1 type II toxin-antitoxin system Phd/YefM family antitoxin [Okeania sp.]